MAEDVVLKTVGLDSLIKSLKGALPKARVGVLANKAMRGPGKSNSGKSSPTNATIGAAHEYGTDTLPPRSFLRVPISEQLQKKMESSRAFDKDVLAEVLKDGSVTPWLKKIAILAESIVHEAFDSGGFGKWAKWKNPNYRNNHGRLLEDTGQLRDSITSEVK